MNNTNYNGTNNSPEQETTALDDQALISGIISAVPLEPFVVNSSTKVHLTIKNISSAPGIRVRFHSEDYLNPRSIDIDIPPATTKLVSINVVPLEKGDRECLVEFAPLYDEEGRLIPGDAADPIVVNKFAFKAREPLVGGLTSNQRSILSNIVKAASMALLIGGVLVVVIPDLRQYLSRNFITSFVCVILIMQLPILGIYFFLMNKLPRG
ncbi:MAG: hypothetical protein GF308_14590 [Candidatus Heimdallarchaeota archaeon]|nr:hypothetical protein [Candidatus Heimdallarchaeota archaeon]